MATGTIKSNSLKYKVVSLAFSNGWSVGNTRTSLGIPSNSNIVFADMESLWILVHENANGAYIFLAVSTSEGYVIANHSGYIDVRIAYMS